ncbi:MAG: ATP-binding protein [Candidatus Omnitrophota bacterium]
MNSSSKSILQGIQEPALFQKISEICSAATYVVSVKELLEVSLKRIIDLFGAKRGSIFILNANGKNLTLKIAQGMEVSEQRQIIKQLGEGIVGQVAAIKKPVVVGDISQDSRFRDFKSGKGAYSTLSFICAPLMIKDKLIGVINIADKKSGDRFYDDELQLLDFLSSQIALNYRRVQLYQKFKNVVRESKTLRSKLGKTSQETSELKNQITLQEKLATIGKLAGGIAHEFNNPLDGVLRYTNLCLEHVKDDEVVRGYLLEIKHGLNRMVNIVRSLLACARNTKPSLKKVDPNQIVEQSLVGVQSDIFHKNIVIEKSLGEGLPPIIDFGLERVSSNLLRNAVDAVSTGGCIKVETALRDNSFIFTVLDNGCGMPKKIVEKIFEPFFTTKDIEKGCGLGLTIVGEIIKNYNGSIKVDSAPGQGTTFIVSIPMDQENDSRTEP